MSLVEYDADKIVCCKIYQTDAYMRFKKMIMKHAQNVMNFLLAKKRKFQQKKKDNIEATITKISSYNINQNILKY